MATNKVNFEKLEKLVKEGKIKRGDVIGIIAYKKKDKKIFEAGAACGNFEELVNEKRKGIEFSDYKRLSVSNETIFRSSEAEYYILDDREYIVTNDCKDFKNLVKKYITEETKIRDKYLQEVLEELSSSQIY